MIKSQVKIWVFDVFNKCIFIIIFSVISVSKVDDQINKNEKKEILEWARLSSSAFSSLIVIHLLSI